jgi:hypothetical protein
MRRGNIPNTRARYWCSRTKGLGWDIDVLEVSPRLLALTVPVVEMLRASEHRLQFTRAREYHAAGVLALVERPIDVMQSVCSEGSTAWSHTRRFVGRRVAAPARGAYANVSNAHFSASTLLRQRWPPGDAR